jgi:hypothetical protein
MGETQTIMYVGVQSPGKEPQVMVMRSGSSQSLNPRPDLTDHLRKISQGPVTHSIEGSQRSGSNSCEFPTKNVLLCDKADACLSEHFEGPALGNCVICLRWSQQHPFLVLECIGANPVKHLCCLDVAQIDPEP